MHGTSEVKERRVEPDVEGFTRELSDLCRRYGVGLSGNAVLFVMEQDDYQLNYSARDGSTLVFS